MRNGTDVIVKYCEKDSVEKYIAKVEYKDGNYFVSEDVEQPLTNFAEKLWFVIKFFKSLNTQSPQIVKFFPKAFLFILAWISIKRKPHH